LLQQTNGSVQINLRVLVFLNRLYDNDYSLVINIYVYETFPTLTPNTLALALNSLDTLSDIRIRAFTLLFLIKMLSITNPA